MKRINYRTESGYECTIIEMYGPTGIGKTTVAMWIEEMYKEKGLKVAIIEDPATESYIQKKSKEVDLIILDELAIRAVKL